MKPSERPVLVEGHETCNIGNDIYGKHPKVLAACATKR